MFIHVCRCSLSLHLKQRTQGHFTLITQLPQTFQNTNLGKKVSSLISLRHLGSPVALQFHSWDLTILLSPSFCTTCDLAEGKAMATYHWMILPFNILCSSLRNELPSHGQPWSYLSCMGYGCQPSNRTQTCQILLQWRDILLQTRFLLLWWLN